MSTFTGRRSKKRTRKSVRGADVVARVLITAGGAGTILAVSGVFLFLLSVVVPLFLGSDVRAREDGDAISSVVAGDEPPLEFGIDEYGVLGWALRSSGALDVFRLDTGTPRARHDLAPDAELTAYSIPALDDLAAFGFADGSVELVTVGFEVEFIDVAKLDPALVAEIDEAPDMVPFDHEDGIVQRTPGGAYRFQRLAVEPVKDAQLAQAEIVALDHVPYDSGPRIVAITGGDDPRVVALQCVEQEDFFTGGKTFEFGEPVELPVGEGREAPRQVAVEGAGNFAYVAWEDGSFARVALDRNLAEPSLAETGWLTSERPLGLLRFAPGEGTLVWTDGQGGVAAGFSVRGADLQVPEAAVGVSEPGHDDRLVRAKELRESGEPATAYGMSQRNRIVALGFRDGSVELYNTTTEERLASLRLDSGEEITALTFAPKEDFLLVGTATGAELWDLDLRHPEVDSRALFGRVWYERYEGPAHTWQSSSGHTGFEPKLGLIPLIVGSIKATFYSMLLGAPLAILAAIYSSEFLSKRAKGIIKPSVELMASLPSVVLGFFAAQVIAPFVDGIVATTLAAIVALPFALLLSAQAWQLLPQPLAVRMSAYRFWFFLPAIGLGLLLARVTGPVLEGWLFAGDLKGWLNWTGREGQEAFASPFGGWMVLLFPFVLLVVAFATERLIGPAIRARFASLGFAGAGRLSLLKFVGLTGAVVLCTAVVAGGLSGLGYDPRASLEVWGIDFSPMGSYVQRNSLVVGFIMGFAIIPIIYTIADDALTAVPDHLRSASLGAGATPWQTAIRIVVPTAMSGIFSALMVGLGRAVGETMIVLMATGNTPILDMNAFSGFRTLAANIAYELPEAVRDSTHYRTLFLAALVLFAMTFAVNTIAEAVRLRFRKRAYQL